MKWFLAAVVLAAGSSEAYAQEYLEQVESPVYEAPGDVATLSGRAATCAAQILKPGFSTAPTVLATDLAGGVVVANNYFEYQETVFRSPVAFRARSKMRIEARVGRYRISHSDIEVFNQDWRRIRMAKEGKRDEMREQLQALSDKVAGCIRQADTPTEW